MLLGLFIAACEPPPWVHQATLAETDVALACDYGETSWMADGGRWDRGYYETNPILGEYPKRAVVGAYLLAIAGAELVAWGLPPKWRSVVYYTVAAVETANVITNNPHGVCGL